MTSSEHHALKLDTNNSRNSWKYTNQWKLNNSLLNENWKATEQKLGQGGIQEEIKNF